MSESLRRPELTKRFYEAVTIAEGEGGFAVLLDGRRMKTPACRGFSVPDRAAAEAAAAEWEAQGEFIEPATMPMTRLLNTIIDGIADDPAPVRDDVARYAETDLLFYRAGEPERLAQRQRERWDPVVAWAEARLGGGFRLAEGVMHVAQPDESLAAVRSHVARETDPFRIAALHQATTLTGSALLALALADGRLTADEAWSLAHLDEDWNIEQWGADEEAAERRARRWDEMRAASLLLGRG
ncbi:ATP12 family chaperone protein [Antarcticirhabdus aurantiaca]|uniref:ATPase n=1 Tax=Antarcticirhabdus aurantiaca TaxID=2606717 RepID=A0ACD4NVP1_9HYPH|nr:ATP12 family protein [Antarcticirhabdus aurantiaca]WAJ30843.1 ATPase [Jeongeuplla avenae]